MIKDDNYKTRDLGESAALLSLGQKIVGMNKVGPVCWFIFTDKKQCEVISNLFWFGECAVDAKTFYDNMVKLKSRIFNSE